MGTSQKVVNRRNFLKGVMLAGAGAAAAGMAGCAAPQQTAADAAATDMPTTGEGQLNAEVINTAKWDFEIPPTPVADDEITAVHEADIIVIGAGVSGLACAASATEEDADVILFAASSQPVSRGGSNHGIGTKIHERLGIKDYTKDTIDGFIRQELARNGYRVDQKKWYKWINNSASTMNWLIDLMEEKGYITTMEIGYTDTACSTPIQAPTTGCKWPTAWSPARARARTWSSRCTRRRSRTKAVRFTTVR